MLAVLTPLLPVVQTTATLNWPQNGQLNNVTLLISLTPVSVTATVPCEVLRTMPPQGGTVLNSAAEGQEGLTEFAFRDGEFAAGRRSPTATW